MRNIVALLLLIGGLGCRDNNSTLVNADLGTVQAPFGCRKAVYLRGRALYPPYHATWSHGVSYLNEVRWEPRVFSAEERAEAARDHSLDFNHLSPGVVLMFSEAPFIRNQMQAGEPFESAAKEWWSRIKRSNEKVGSCYRRWLPFIGQEAAEAKARALIDTTIAMRNAGDPHPPRFGSGGSVSIFYPGRGYQMSTNCPPSFRLFPRRTGVRFPETVPIETARSQFGELAMYMQHNSSSVIIYGMGGSIMAGGPDADRIFGQIDAALAGQPDTSGRGALLGEGEIRQIVAESQPR